MKQCMVEGCNDKAIASGVCELHRFLPWKGLGEVSKKNSRACRVYGCKDYQVVDGLCSRHFQQSKEIALKRKAPENA